MARPYGIKHHGVGKSAYGAGCTTNADGVGTYAIMMTLTGSYGETCHRIVGGSYWDIDKCTKKALKYHAEGKLFVEVVNLQTKARISAVEIRRLQAQQLN